MQRLDEFRPLPHRDRARWSSGRSDRHPRPEEAQVGAGVDESSCRGAIVQFLGETIINTFVGNGRTDVAIWLQGSYNFEDSALPFSPLQRRDAVERMLGTLTKSVLAQFSSYLFRTYSDSPETRRLRSGM
jgi:hypothetical protein